MKTRKFSLEDDFMNISIDDLIFGYIQHIATYAPEKKILYVTKEDVSKAKTDMALIAGVKTTRTISNKINKMVEKGLLEERIFQDKGVYVIPQETKGKYEILQDDMVWYIVCTRQLNALKIYLYLFNKYKWKQSQGEMYSFTNSELLTAIGYATSTAQNRNTEYTEMLLQSFKREGVIDYVEYTDKENSVHVTTRKRLLFVAKSIEELKEV